MSLRLRATRPLVIALGLLIALNTPSVAAAGDGPTLRVDAQVGGETGPLALAGSTLYLAIGSRLDVLDVSRPGQPVVVGTSAPLTDTIVGLSVSNGYVYLAAGRAGLRVLDAHDLTHPTEIAAVDLGGPVARVAVSDTTAYVAAGDAGLHILDVSDPTAPQELGSYNAAYGVLDVAVARSVASVAVDEGTIRRGTRVALPRLRTLDVSDPTNPVELGAADVTAGSGVVASLMLADGPRIYQYWNRYGASGCDAGGIHVLDVGDPTAPATVGELAGGCYGDAIAGTTALFAVGSQLEDRAWLYRPDVSANPTEFHPGMQVRGLALANGTLYAAGTDHARSQSVVRVFDVSGGGAPRSVGAYTEASLAHANGTGSGDRLFVADDVRFSILDLSRPERPVEVGSLMLPPSKGVVSTWRADVQVAAPFAYVVNGDSLITVDVADPAQPAIVDQQGVGRETPGLARQGAFLYLLVGTLPAPGQFGLDFKVVVMDVSRPAHPRPVGEWPLPRGLWNAIAVDGGYAYLAGGSLLVLDVRDPAHPRPLGDAPIPGAGGQRLAVIGSTVFVASFKGVHAFDVSDPTQPRWLSTVGEDTGYASSVVADGPRLDVASWSGGGVQVYDVTDPTAPVLVGAYGPIPNGQVAASVFAAAGHVATSTYSGLWVLHVP